MIELVGLKLPVACTETGKTLGYRIIQKQFFIENFAAIAITCWKKSDILLLLSYEEAQNLIKTQNKYNKLKRLK